MNSKLKEPAMRMVVLSLGYWFGSHTLGFLVHPYQSVRRIRRERVLEPMVWLPSVCLAGWWLLGVVVVRVGVLEGVGLPIMAEWLSGWSNRQWWLSLVFMWVGVFLGLWQVVLAYLFWRFRDL